MDIRIQSDGLLYPPKNEKKHPLPPPEKKLAQSEPPAPRKEGTEWEDLLLLAVGFMVLKGKEKVDIPLLLALAYVLFDSCFSLKKLL